MADSRNHRIMRFKAGESEGQVVAGTGKQGFGLDQLYRPAGVTLLPDGGMLVADQNNHRIIRFSAGESEGQVVAGTGEPGSGLDQLNWPCWCHLAS